MFFYSPDRGALGGASGSSLGSAGFHQRKEATGILVTTFGKLTVLHLREGNFLQTGPTDFAAARVEDHAQLDDHLALDFNAIKNLHCKRSVAVEFILRTQADCKARGRDVVVCAGGAFGEYLRQRRLDQEISIFPDVESLVRSRRDAEGKTCDRRPFRHVLG